MDFGRGCMKRKGRWFETISIATISLIRHGMYSFQYQDTVRPPISVSQA